MPANKYFLSEEISGRYPLALVNFVCRNQVAAGGTRIGINKIQAGQVGYGAGDFEDTCVGASA